MEYLHFTILMMPPSEETLEFTSVEQMQKFIRKSECTTKVSAESMSMNRSNIRYAISPFKHFSDQDRV